MLCIMTLNKRLNFSNYYDCLGFYTREGQLVNTKWFGKQANTLGFNGNISCIAFEELLRSKLPDSTELQTNCNNKGESLYRARYELVFSACASASILALKDRRIIDAHNQAVITTLKHIEENMVDIQKERAIKQQDSKGLIVATFLHKVSRLLTPYLHTHCVFLKPTKSDDKICCLQAWHSSSWLKSHGALYRQTFTESIIALGYTIELTGGSGRFEIKEVSKEILKLLVRCRMPLIV